MEVTTLTTALVDKLTEYADAFVDVGPRLVVAVVVVLATWAVTSLAKGIVRRLGKRFRMRQNLIDVLAMIAGVGLWLVGILLALTIVFPSITPGKALTTLGLGSVAIGFAFKDTFENFLAGILILLREPFRIGDHIECDDVEGLVEEITIRDSHVRQTDGQRVVVPNHILFQNAVVVRTDRDLRRTTIMCGVAYREDVDAARSIIEDAVISVDTVRDDVKDVEVFAQAFGASSIDFEVTWWTGSRPIDIRRSRDQVIAAVKRALDDAGVEIPFPYRTLTFKEPLNVKSSALDKEEAQSS
ncbi:mechanosensitive ion channel family protein [Roseobacter sp.]|uniref:mechanosensitive ion channel family protein n=1 Tax=Roseobacter sp. TaxID=1907202 RepID=UPI0029660188|nr:mechanosensitive ion channel family protein [Roseobacter sp.]MDW3183774.1 mechanosensitive ion channel family protein [Roseobacter sp.]